MNTAILSFGTIVLLVAFSGWYFNHCFILTFNNGYNGLTIIQHALQQFTRNYHKFISGCFNTSIASIELLNWRERWSVAARTFLFVFGDNTCHYSPQYPLLLFLLLTSNRKSPRRRFVLLRFL